MERGTLFLVVGPSGAGKDTLLDAARTHLTGDPRFVFPDRVITRPAESGGEAHRAVTDDEFRTLSSAGAFLLEWSAHNLLYGIPASAGHALDTGRHAVINVSRGVLDDARSRLQPVQIISIEVPTHVLRMRLTERGRETTEDIEHRIARAAAFKVIGPDVVTVQNDSTIDRALARFLNALAGR